MKFNNKILFAITVLSIVIGLLLSNNIEALKNFKTVTCIVTFFSAIMIYNAILKEKENKLAKQKAEKEGEPSTESAEVSAEKDQAEATEGSSVATDEKEIKILTEGEEDNVAKREQQTFEPKNDAE